MLERVVGALPGPSLWIVTLRCVGAVVDTVPHFAVLRIHEILEPVISGLRKIAPGAEIAQRQRARKLVEFGGNPPVLVLVGLAAREDALRPRAVLGQESAVEKSAPGSFREADHPLIAQHQSGPAHHPQCFAGVAKVHSAECQIPIQRRIGQGEEEVVARRIESPQNRMREQRQCLLPLCPLGLGQDRREQNQIRIHLVQIGHQLFLVESLGAVVLEHPLHGPKRLTVIAEGDVLLDGEDVRQHLVIPRQVVVHGEAQKTVAQLLRVPEFALWTPSVIA